MLLTAKTLKLMEQLEGNLRSALNAANENSDVSLGLAQTIESQTFTLHEQMQEARLAEMRANDALRQL